MTSFYFSGCSWGCIYHIGVYQQIYNQLYNNKLINTKFGGSSSGGLIALGASLQKTPKQCLDLYNNLSNVARKYGVFGKMSIYHEIVLSKWLPDDGNEYKHVNGKLFIGITKPIAKFELVSHWNSNRELKDTLHASMHIPFYMTHIKKVNNCYAIDGGFTKNISSIDKNTITISPNMKSADIKPSKFLSLKECFAPTNNNRLIEILELGKSDYNKYILNYNNNTKYKYKKSKKIYNKLLKYFLCTNLWILRFIEQYGFTNILLKFYIIYCIFNKNLFIYIYYIYENSYCRRI